MAGRIHEASDRHKEMQTINDMQKVGKKLLFLILTNTYSRFVHFIWASIWYIQLITVGMEEYTS